MNDPKKPPVPPMPAQPLNYQTPVGVPPALGYGRVLCPTCGHQQSKPVSFTWWGGLIGPKMLNHVTCVHCGQGYNGKTGRLNTTAIIIYSVVVPLIILVVAVVVFIGFD
jgi:hypothetical protein